jgi:hypothetical protein
METGRFSVNWIKESLCKFSVIFVLDKPGATSRDGFFFKTKRHRRVFPLKTARAGPSARRPNIFLTRKIPRHRRFPEEKSPATAQA